MTKCRSAGAFEAMSWMLAAMPQDSIIVSRHQLSAADGRRELDIATALQGANHVMQLLQALAETSSTAGANDEPPVLTNLQMHMLMTHLLSKHQHCQPPDVHSSLDAGTALVLSICCSAYFLKAPPPPAITQWPAGAPCKSNCSLAAFHFALCSLHKPHLICRQNAARQ
jgi:hypothetical protein